MNEKKSKNYEINWERYEKAISNVLKNFVERGFEVITIEEIWFETSLPKDLILEVFQRSNLKIPKEIKEIKDKNSIIWRSEE
ncbi:MAG: hypothetical protein PWP54_1044 [Thermosipho sp. (in: thermotogales)]|nr:hypothetical protein [Thermosipho sp. (in: thermotogales)]MDN5325137.1 hypothetical protein [Thermosipho sp. (in: thermotogales)]